MAYEAGRVRWVFVRKVRTASGAVAVQVMRKAGRRDVLVEHVGSAHTDGSCPGVWCK